MTKKRILPMLLLLTLLISFCSCTDQSGVKDGVMSDTTTESDNPGHYVAPTPVFPLDKETKDEAPATETPGSAAGTPAPAGMPGDTEGAPAQTPAGTVGGTDNGVPGNGMFPIVP